MVKIKGTSHEDQNKFLIISRSVLLRMKNVSGKICGENQNTPLRLSNSFFSEICSFNEVVWKNVVDPDRPQITIWRVRIACWLTKVTDTRLECTILISFPLQQWLNELTSMLRYTYIASPVFINL
jgi:hypothetical protein